MTDNKVTITVTTRPDSFGRQRFCTEWPANNIGPRCNEVGRRGQMSHANVAEAVARWRARGHEVEVISEEGDQ